jgi:hypothetical protein
LTDTHPAVFEKQVAKKRNNKEERAKQKTTHYASLAGGLKSQNV